MPVRAPAKPKTEPEIKPMRRYAPGEVCPEQKEKERRIIRDV